MKLIERLQSLRRAVVAATRDPRTSVHVRTHGYGLRISRTTAGWDWQVEAPDPALAWLLTHPKFAWRAVVAAERTARAQGTGKQSMGTNRSN